MDEREAVFAQREEAMADLGRSFFEHIEEQDGARLLNNRTQTGWVVLEYPFDRISSLSEREDLAIVQAGHDPTDSDGSYLGNQRSNNRVGVEAYWDNGHKGGTSNPDTNFGAMTVGVVESQYFEDHFRSRSVFRLWSF